MRVESNKYLTFGLGDEGYAIPILKIKEIIGMLKITKVPRLPAFIKGVINLRGQIIPIIDLRLKFGLEAKDYDDRTSIIVVELETDSTLITSGIVVDTVNEVLEIDAKDIEDPPKYGTEVNQGFLIGMGKVKDNVIMLLNVMKILSVDEIKKLETI
jgi:purine-binding chemotaxis protein CheW